MKLNELIKIYDGVVSKQWCDDVMGSIDHDKFTRHSESGYSFDQISASTTYELKRYSLEFLDVFCDTAEEYFKELDLYQFVEQTQFGMTEDIRIKKYTKNSGMGFDEHVDVVDFNSASRYLTGILYLNQNDGDTIFRGLSVNPVPGRLVMFPPMWMFPHKAKTPSDNDKYIMMTSLRY